MRPNLVYWFVSAILAAAVCVIAPQAARAGVTITVNTNADNTGDDGLCTLREAITAANTNAPVNGADDCNHDGSAGTDTINFAADYTITLGSQLPDITSDMIITGNGQAGTIIEASVCNPVTSTCLHTYRVFNVTSTGILTLEDLTVRNGQTITNDIGGNIKVVSGQLILNRTTISGGRARDGGGVFVSNAQVNVTNSTFSGNLADDGAIGIDYGGGLSTENSTAVIDSSTFSGNTASDLGGAIQSRASDGIMNLQLTNSTISANAVSGSGGGGVYLLGIGSSTLNVTITNNTITGNTGGGIYLNLGPFGTVTLRNSIVANSVGASDCFDGGSTVTDGGGNIVEDNTCGFTGGADPQLGPLADNGGFTLTHALSDTSPALDAAIGANCPATDQRGVARGFNAVGAVDFPQAGDCDIGAYEYAIFALTVEGAGSGNGTMIDAVPGGTVACTSTAGIASGDCSEQAVAGSAFSLMATPDGSFVFVSWTGCDSTSTTTLPNDTCNLTLSADRTVTATFDAPDLQIGKDDGGITARPGDVVVYTLTYGDSNTDATGVVISETVPADTTFNATASTAGWSCADGSTAGTACDFAVGTVSAGSGGSVLFAVNVNAPVSQGTTFITNTATIADDGSHGADPNPADNTATDTTPLIAAAQTVAIDPLGRFVIYTALDGCATDTLFYQMLDSVGNPIGAPIRLVSCGLLAGNIIGTDVLIDRTGDIWISFGGFDPADGKYLMKIDAIGNILMGAKQVVVPSKFGSTAGATALAVKGCCKLQLYVAGSGGSVFRNLIDKTTGSLLRTKKTYVLTANPLGLHVTQRAQTPAFLALEKPDETFRAIGLNGKGLPDGTGWRLCPATDGGHEAGSVSADGLAALSNDSDTDKLYLQMLKSNGLPDGSTTVIATDAVSAVDISNLLSSGKRYAVYSTDTGFILLQVVNGTTGAKIGKPITVK